MDDDDDGDIDGDDHHDVDDGAHDDDDGDQHRDGDNDNDGKYDCDEDAPPPYASEFLVSTQSLRSLLPPSRRSSSDHHLCLGWSYLQNFHVFYLSTPSWR